MGLAAPTGQPPGAGLDRPALLRIPASTRTSLLLALGHWLVYLQLIKMFLPKTVEDDWFLFLLGLVQVLVGVGHQPERPGRASCCSPGRSASLWVLGLFSLHRESLRDRAAAGRDVDARRRTADDPYPGLLDLAVRARDAARDRDDAGPGRPDLPGDAPADRRGPARGPAGAARPST